MNVRINPSTRSLRRSAWTRRAAVAAAAAALVVPIGCGDSGGDPTESAEGSADTGDCLLTVSEMEDALNSTGTDGVRFDETIVQSDDAANMCLFRGERILNGSATGERVSARVGEYTDGELWTERYDEALEYLGATSSENEGRPAIWLGEAFQEVDGRYYYTEYKDDLMSSPDGRAAQLMSALVKG